MERRIPRGETGVQFDVAIPQPHLWSPRDPFLYDVEARLAGAGAGPDVVKTYFGMRKISVVDLPGTNHRYVAVNDEPVYLQLTLDQAYHPEGFYTFPSDAFVRDEVLRARQIGLTGLREHVKVETPRKLYWADRLGVLIMADVPNSWGEPTADMRQEIEGTLRQMIRRDYNHPSVFAWVPFNETWGLFTKVPKAGQEKPEQVYEPETQQWVASVYRLAKSLDATRLVEDNSVCCGRGHTETDINSWHDYLPGWAWDERLDEVSKGTSPGSTWNFEAGFKQDRQPDINSEFGNVWGYEGSTGDVDWSWDYHRAVNAFRRHPKVAGWLYTEHHDVINEWNGYWRFDRTEKFTGMEDLVEGMTLADLHSPLYVAVGTPADLSRSVKAGDTVDVPLWASFLTGNTALGDHLGLQARLYGWDTLGRKQTTFTTRRTIAYRPWMSEALEPLSVPMPKEPGVAVLAVELTDQAGLVLHRNFTTFVVEGSAARRGHPGGRAARARGANRPGEVLERPVVRQAVERARRAEGERGGIRALRVPAGVAGGAQALRCRRRLVSRRSIRQTALRQGSGGCRRDGRRLHARQRHPRSEPQPQLLSHDGPGAVSERGDDPGQRGGRGTPRPAGRSRGSPGDPVLARAAQGSAIAGGGLLRVPARSSDPARGAGAGRGRRGVADPPGGGRSLAGRPRALRRALRALPGRSHGPLRPQSVTTYRRERS